MGFVSLFEPSRMWLLECTSNCTCVWMPSWGRRTHNHWCFARVFLRGTLQLMVHENPLFFWVAFNNEPRLLFWDLFSLWADDVQIFFHHLGPHHSSTQPVFSSWASVVAREVPHGGCCASACLPVGAQNPQLAPTAKTVFKPLGAAQQQQQQLKIAAKSKSAVTAAHLVWCTACKRLVYGGVIDFAPSCCKTSLSVI